MSGRLGLCPLLPPLSPPPLVLPLLGRLAIIPVALFYVLVVFLAQYTSWGGAWSLFDQHAFLLPVPFLSM